MADQNGHNGHNGHNGQNGQGAMQVIAVIGIMPDGNLGINYQHPTQQVLGALVQITEQVRLRAAVEAVQAAQDPPRVVPATVLPFPLKG